jgi:hypothetical protein
MDVGAAHPKHPSGRVRTATPQTVYGLQLVSANLVIAAVQIQRDELPIVRGHELRFDELLVSRVGSPQAPLAARRVLRGCFGHSPMIAGCLARQNRLHGLDGRLLHVRSSVAERSSADKHLPLSRFQQIAVPEGARHFLPIGAMEEGETSRVPQESSDWLGVRGLAWESNLAYPNASNASD